MASVNAEIMRRLYEAWTDRPEAALALLDEKFEYVNPPDAVHPGTRHGHRGWLQACADLDDSFDTWVHEPGELTEAGEKVVVMTTFRARGRGSSVNLEKFEPHVWTIREGRIVRFEWFNDREEALRAAGLAE